MELVRPFSRTADIQVVLFDFDGTLSLIREGWQAVMLSFMLESLGSPADTQNQARLERHVREYVTRLTGKQTIYQMIQLAEEIRARGGRPEDPLVYKRRYHDRLWQHIEGRIRALRSRQERPEDWLLPGSRDILENLSRRGIVLYLASGTDECFVKDEAELLGLTGYFGAGRRIFGAQDAYRSFSKQLVIERILAEQKVKGQEFAAFGDGYVEIENTKQAGGTAVGVASDEERRCGVDEWKRQRLIAAGADIIVPDFRNQEELVALLFD